MIVRIPHVAGEIVVVAGAAVVVGFGATKLQQ